MITFKTHFEFVTNIRKFHLSANERFKDCASVVTTSGTAHLSRIGLKTTFGTLFGRYLDEFETILVEI